MIPEEIREYCFRASGLGNIMTNLTSITNKQLEELKRLEKKETLTEKQGQKLGELKAKRDAPDELPTGAKTYIQECFNHAYHGRRKEIDNKFLDKGNYCEEDSLRLISDVTGTLLIKNRKLFESINLKGTPDCVYQDCVIDAKTSWDLHTFTKAELTTLYEWQLKAYCYLTGSKRAKLAYCLVNAPEHLIMKTKESYYYKLGCNEESEQLKEAYERIEREMIFDIKRFKKDNPTYDFSIEDWKSDIHPKQRIKMFDVAYTTSDARHIERRLKMAKKHLVELYKEEEEKKKLTFKI